VRAEAKTVALSSGLGVLAALSAAFLPTRFVALGGVALLAAMIYALRKAGKDGKWTVANSVWPYATTWYASWVVVYASLYG